MSVNDENHVLGLWIGGGVSSAALELIEFMLRDGVEAGAASDSPVAVKTELLNMANSCFAQLSKLREPPKPDPLRYL